MDDSNLQSSWKSISDKDERTEVCGLLSGSCQIGKSGKSECQMTSSHHRGENILKPVCDFSLDQQALLSRRTELLFDENSMICCYHEAVFLTKYEFLQKHCANPFSKSNHVIRKSLRVVDFTTADQLKAATGQEIKPGQKVCTRCLNELSVASRPKEQSDSEADFVEKMETNEKMNASLTALDISPLKFSSVSKRDSCSYAKRKIVEVHNAVVSKIAQAGGMNEEKLMACEKCLDYDALIKELKEKLCTSTYAQKIQILTLAPNSWSREKVVEVFGVTEHMVKQARALKKADGVLAIPGSKAGKKLSEEVKQRVEAFYEDDEFSRMCPGKKDFVSIRINGTKVHKQKRLLLCNLKELFIVYRSHNGTEIGFSKFCELRPKWCVTVGASGTHSVCVCTLHQNLKLMLLSSPIPLDYKVLMGTTVCELESKECMLHRCDKCPGKEGVTAYMANAFSKLDPEQQIEFKQWIFTDRATIEARQLPLEEFSLELCEKVTSLTSHHFIAKHQSNYLKSSKESLTESKLIILLDFAENYSFVVQDAVQGFHWENSQATVHPIVVYCKTSDQEITSLSYCIISDSLRHDTVAVYVFLNKLVSQLKQKFPKVKCIQYFSDGSAAQYKNYKNFANLCHHESDLGICAEWNFFATSHGKSPCDGIGGTVKRLAARASLQRPSGNQILTPTDLFAYCDKNVSGITFLFVSKEDIESARAVQEKRFEKCQTVAGTRDNHQFKPASQSSVTVSRVSSDCVSFLAHLYQPETQSLGLKVSELQPGQFVACIYDNVWWIGNICEISLSEQDASIDFMHPHGPNASFHWPVRKDICWVPEQHIIAVLPAPSAYTMGRSYSYPEAIINNICQLYSLFN